MLYLIATPIGNLEDITLRAIRVLGEADIVLAEDTRKAGFLLNRLNIKKKLVSFFEHNEEKKTPQVIEQLKQGKNIALVSSAGTPTISDPGYKLIREARKQGLNITSIPGPSSVINALALTSIPHDKFFFLGYLPKKKNARKKILEQAKLAKVAVVFLESPFRIRRALENAREVFGNARAALAREMTKKFEEILEGPIEEVLLQFKEREPKGEFTVIIENRGRS